MRRAIAASLAVSLVLLLACGAGIFMWTLCVVGAVLVALYALHAFGTARTDTPTPEPGGRRWSWLSPEWAYLAIVAFLLLSLVPLPLPATVITGPHRYQQNQLVTGMLASATELHLLDPPRALFATTRNVAGTLRILLLLVTCFTAARLASRLTATTRSAFLHGLVALGALVAVVGHVGQWHVPQGDTLWWVIPVGHGLPGPIGGFVNPNHFGSFIAVLALVALGMLVTDIRERRWAAGAACAVAFAIMTVALVFSMSRGSLVSYAGGVVAVVAIVAARRRPMLAVTTILLVAALGAGTLYAARSHPAVRHRLLALRDPTRDSSFTARLDAWQDTLAMWRTYPLIGCGANAFRMVHPQFQANSIRGDRKFAENEYLQTLAEMGVLGTLLVAALAFAFWRERAFARRQGDGHAGSLAVTGALVVVAVHAMGDFALHLPVYTLVFAVLVGFWSAPSPTPPRPVQARLTRACAALNILLILVLSAFAPLLQSLDANGAISAGGLPFLGRALTCAPTWPYAWRRFGMRARARKTPEAERLALRCVTQAAAYDPNNYGLWMDLGTLRLEAGDRDGARAAFRRVKELRSWVTVPEVPET